MADKTYIELRTAFFPENNSYKVSTGDKRANEYRDGIEQFFKLYSENQLNADVYIVDNTIGSVDEINPIIRSVIPDFVKFILKKNNTYGRVNKGAGLVEAWKDNTALFVVYDWIIYFEPRLFMKDFGFINTFVQNKENLFSVNNELKCFNTGLFCSKASHILNYAENTHPQKLVDHSISIEYDLYDFFVKNNIPFSERAEMGVIWKNSIVEQEIHM